VSHEGTPCLHGRSWLVAAVPGKSVCCQHCLWAPARPQGNADHSASRHVNLCSSSTQLFDAVCNNSAHSRTCVQVVVLLDCRSIIKPAHNPPNGSAALLPQQLRLGSKCQLQAAICVQVEMHAMEVDAHGLHPPACSQVFPFLDFVVFLVLIQQTADTSHRVLLPICIPLGQYSCYALCGPCRVQVVGSSALAGYHPVHAAMHPLCCVSEPAACLAASDPQWQQADEP